MKLPEIRARLLEKAAELKDEELAYLAYETIRRPCPFPRARAKASALSFEAQQAVRAAKRAEPGLSYHELAVRFGTNIGRISEALNGVRE